MLYIDVGSGGAKASSLGFGCGPFLGRAGRRASWTALTAAFDAGITFYDTARSYGYGECEALLGEFFEGKRDRVVLSTKFGIIPARQSAMTAIAKPLVRGTLVAFPSLRKLVQSQVHSQFEKAQFTVSVLKRSVEESLRNLRTDYIDILFMHDAPASVLNEFELLREIEKLVESGKVLVAGISAVPDVISVALERCPVPLTAMQFPCNVFDLSMTERLAGSRSRDFLFLANHPFGGAPRVTETRCRLSQVAASDETPFDIRAKLGSVDDSVLAEVILQVIARESGIQIIIPAMVRPDHVLVNLKAMAASRFSLDEIKWLRKRLTDPRNNGRADPSLSTRKLL